MLLVGPHLSLVSERLKCERHESAGLCGLDYVVDHPSPCRDVGIAECLAVQRHEFGTFGGLVSGVGDYALEEDL